MTHTSALKRWWVVPRPNPAALLRLFYFPHAGGNASICREWPEKLPSAIEVCAAQLPGRANRISEPPLGRISDLVAAIGAAITPMLDKPLVLFGHSMGAIISFEVARWLRRNRALQPACLVVSGRRAAHLPHTAPSHHLNKDEDFLAKLGDLNGTPADLFRETELMQLLLPTLRADFKAVETYQYVDEPPLSCPVLVFGGCGDEETGQGRLDAWQLQTNGAFSKHMIEGGHFFIQSNENQVLSILGMELLRTISKLRGYPQGPISSLA